MILVRMPLGFEPERTWVVRVFLQDLLAVEFRSISEHRADWFVELPGGGGISVPDLLFRQSDAWDGLRSLPPEEPPPVLKVPGLYRSPCVRSTLPCLYSSKGAASVCERDEQRIVFKFDLFAAAFFMLARLEEWDGSSSDKHGRFPPEETLAYRHGFLDRPLVDEYAELFWACMEDLSPGLVRGPQSSQVILTHDIDHPLSVSVRPRLLALRAVGGDLLVRRSPGTAAQRVGALLAGGRRGDRMDPNNTFDFLMETAERSGQTAAFNFIAGHTGGVVDGYPIDGYCDLEHPFVAETLERIDQRGHEIGLHPSYNTFRDPEALRREFRRLRDFCAESGVKQSPNSGRMHYLRWDPIATFGHLSRAGIQYDSTMGYFDRMGFRCGTCREFSTYDPATRSPLPLRQRPLIVMESAALSFLGVSTAEAGHAIVEMSRTCKRFRGNFVLLWHNNRVVTPAEQTFYSDIVAAVA